ncbi:hypothetical protein YC2023_035590 [Brassica napus]
MVSSPNFLVRCRTRSVGRSIIWKGNHSGNFWRLAVGDLAGRKGRVATETGQNKDIAVLGFVGRTLREREINGKLDLHDKLSDEIHLISRSHFLKEEEEEEPALRRREAAGLRIHQRTRRLIDLCLDYADLIGDRDHILNYPRRGSSAPTEEMLNPLCPGLEVVMAGTSAEVPLPPDHEAREHHHLQTQRRQKNIKKRDVLIRNKFGPLGRDYG